MFQQIIWKDDYCNQNFVTGTFKMNFWLTLHPREHFKIRVEFNIFKEENTNVRPIAGDDNGTKNLECELDNWAMKVCAGGWKYYYWIFPSERGKATTQ